MKLPALSALRLYLLLVVPALCQRDDIFLSALKVGAKPPRQRSRGVRLSDELSLDSPPGQRRTRMKKSCKGMGKGMKGCGRAPARTRAPTPAPSSSLPSAPPTPPGSPSAAPSGGFCDDLCTCAANGHKYKFVKKKVSWQTANASAVALPKCCGKTAHLVTIESDDENVLVSDLVFFSSINPYAWIGLSDLAKDGKFEWVTGEPVNYTAWDPLIFDGGAARSNCGEIDSMSYLWNDYICAVKQHYVVEYDCDT